MTIERFDVIIVGAGLSGIGAARYLRTRLAEKSFVILETKPRMGGTWDLFRYPGIRSDSDMHTMGYAFKPWQHPKAISEGGAIIDQVTPNMPAATAGMKPGDIIVSLNGVAVAARQALNDALANFSPDDEVKLTVKRGDKLEDLKVKLAADPATIEEITAFAMVPNRMPVRLELRVA